jgi:type IV pilus assembly protein PilE
MRQDRAEGGFTIIELMIVVVIIAVLAAIVVPTWLSESRKGKYDPEVRAMFAEISAKEEAYKAEQGAGLYRDTPTDACPPVSPDGTSFTTACLQSDGGSADWQALRINETDSKIRCSYQITAGCAGDGTNCPSTVTPASPTPSFGTTPPTTLVGPWYYIIAICDMDGAGGTNAEFLTTSWDNSTQKLNYGQ